MKVNRSHKKGVSYPLLATLIILIFLSHSSAYASSKVVARVGDTEITEYDVDEALSRYIPPGGFHANIQRPQMEKYRKDAINELIESELLYREARKRGIKAQDKNVQAVIDANVSKYGSKEAFMKVLEKSGLTLEAFKERVKKYQIVNSLIQDLKKESRYSDKELKDEYEKNKTKYTRPEAIHLYEILIKVESTAREEEWQEKKKFAEQILKKIMKGGDFGELAYQYSEDPYKYKSGDLGMVHRGRLMPPELEDAAFSLKKGEVSNVIRTIYGFHILKAGERAQGGPITYEEMKKKYKTALDDKRFESVKSLLLDKLKKETKVEVIK